MSVDNPSAEMTLDDLVIRSSSHTPFFGVYLAAHAVSDAHCMCHASVGCKVKTQSHLVHHEGIRSAHRRRSYSQFIDEDLINGSTQQLEDEIVAWQGRQDSAVVFLDTSTPISLQGMSLAGVVQRTEEKTGVPIVPVECRNYEEDLYTGYQAVVGAIFEKLDWDLAEPEADEVALYGYPFDRYEADHSANVNELRRMLYAIGGFKAKAIFFAGEPWKHLTQCIRAGHHLFMPWAHKQTKVLKRTTRKATHKRKGTKVAFPMSLVGTSAWLRECGAALGADEARVEAFIEAESTRLKPLCELARRELAGKKFAVFADPPRMAGVLALLMEMEMLPRLCGVLHFSLGGREAVAELLKSHWDLELPDSVQWLEDATPKVVKALEPGDIDVVIGTTIEREHLIHWRLPYVEFGFPSEMRHHIFPSPWMGYNGVAGFLQQIMHAVEERRWDEPDPHADPSEGQVRLRDRATGGAGGV